MSTDRTGPGSEGSLQRLLEVESAAADIVAAAENAAADTVSRARERAQEIEGTERLRLERELDELTERLERECEIEIGRMRDRAERLEQWLSEPPQDVMESLARGAAERALEEAER